MLFTLPRHSLVAIGSEVVIYDSDFHVPVSDITVVVTEKNNLVLVSKPIVGNGDVSGASGDVNKPIVTPVKRVVVDPDLRRSDQSNGIAVHVSQGNDLGIGAHDLDGRLRLAVVDDEAMDYDIGGPEDHETGIPGDVDCGAAAVDGREAAYEKRLLKHNVHVLSECDPNFGSDHCGAVSECAWAGVYWVVAGVGDFVAYEVSSDVVGHFSDEAHRTNGELLPVSSPVWVGSPAFVDGVHVQALGFGIRNCGEESEGNERENEELGAHFLVWILGDCCCCLLLLVLKA